MFELIKYYADLKQVNAYVSIYQPIAGWKSVLLSRDEDCDNMFTPWQTGYFGYEMRSKAIVDALLWAKSEDIPLYIEGLTVEEEELINRHLAEMELNDKEKEEENMLTHFCYCGAVATTEYVDSEFGLDLVCDKCAEKIKERGNVHGATVWELTPMKKGDK